ncbi:MAG: DJ-1/PfpI family protein [Candidatus Micrarchaeales archaeon]|nr:DJ-1/PfpI family protein [Candidatus Micrarchaeales archaeon]
MRFLVFIAPNNFRDETVSTIKMFFERWGIDYDISSYSKKECVGAHGAVYSPSVNTNVAAVGNYDGIVLVDGNGIEDYKLYEYRPLLDLLLQFNSQNKIIGAVNNAIKVVARANIINGKKMVVPDDVETKRAILLFHGVPSDKNVEISGNIATMKGSSLETQVHELLQHIGAI